MDVNEEWDTGRKHVTMEKDVLARRQSSDKLQKI